MVRFFTFAAFFLLLFLGAGLSGCIRELELPAQPGSRRLVLLGELVADDTLSFRLGQSIPVSQGSTAQPPDPAGIAAAILKENVQITTLLPRTDDHTPDLKTLVFSAADRIFSGSRYTVQIAGGAYPGIAATVQVPHPFVAAVIDTATVSYAGAVALRVLIRVYDPPGEVNYYGIETLRQSFSLSGKFTYNTDTFDLVHNKDLYDSLKAKGIKPPYEVDTTYNALLERLPVYTNDVLTENLKLATPFTAARRILLTDATFNGGRHDLQVFIPKDRFRGSFPADLGRIVLSVKSITPEYFSYLRSYETFTPTTSTGYLAQPVRIESNVTGGLGVLGGSFRVPFYYTFDSNPF